MPRRRRRITSKKCYELCFRAREGLPLVAYGVMRLLLGSIVARTQRDDKVVLCHDLWNGSHCHMIIVALDSEMCTRFYGEVQKRITDAIKRLLGLKFLDLWEGNPMVAEIADLDAAIDRISYIYANPAQDNLVDQISEFPGFSSWREFKSNTTHLVASTTEEFPWIRLPSIPALESRVLSRGEDARLAKQLRSENKVIHALVRNPNAWMRCFGVRSDAEAVEINSRILQNLELREEAARQKRKTEKRSVLGAERLKSQPIMKPHVPKKKDRKVFLLCSIKELRIKLIEEFKSFCEQCSECFRRWKARDFSGEWPNGAFRPPLPPIVNLLTV